MIKCQICGKEFSDRGLTYHITHIHNITKQQYYDAYIKQENDGICPICNNPTKFNGKNYNICCSKECTFMYKYGVSHNSQIPEVKAKMHTKEAHQKSANAKNYHEIMRKGAKTKQILYGDKNYNNRDKAKITCLDKYGVENPLQVPEIGKKVRGHKISKQEDFLYDFLLTIYNGQISRNQKGIIGSMFELDLYMPEINLAVEYNGIRYHSIEMGKPKDRILKKSILCREKGIRLVHIYEFEDFEKQKRLLKDLILGQDNYNKYDFNKNNFRKTIPKPKIVYQNKHYTVYGAGKLY